MYTVRVLAGLQLGSDGPAFPMHEALLDAVDITVPSGSILNPEFAGSPDQCSACAIGQTETSQRLVDALWQALDIAACSQGTINNLLFGGAALGFYETIAGGAGATRTAHGASAVHTHISNTRLTDAEVLERRYPVQLERLRIRTGSGGDGLHRGGDGITRRLRFLEPVELSFLSQRRESSPRGSHGGLDGTRGAQRIIRANGTVEEVPGITAAHLARGDAFEVETPGGGGWGSPAPAKG
jgi:5-oxoprolinase (ATP-hydrolysing)